MFSGREVGNGKWIEIVCVGSIILGTTLLSCCKGQTDVRGIVVLYTSVPTDIIAGVETAFEEQYPGVDLQIYRANTNDIIFRIEDDLTRGAVKGDVVWVADFTVGEELKNRDLLLQYTPPEADALLPTLQDPDGYYFGARLLNMVVAYNADKVARPPTSYYDLLDPYHCQRIGHASPTSGAFSYFMGALLQNDEFGEEYFRQLAANQPSVQDNTETTRKIATGELDMGVTIDFTVRALLKKAPATPIAMVYPETGVVMVPSPIAIFKDSVNIDGAKTFERYILSAEGQSLLRDLAGVMPVRLDIKPPEDIESITQLRVMPTDPSWILAHNGEITSTFEELFGVP